MLINMQPCRPEASPATTRIAAAVVVGLYLVGLAAVFGPPVVEHVVSRIIFGGL